MPYIQEERRKHLDDKVNQLAMAVDVDLASREGELSYVITRLITKTSVYGNYREMNANLGVLDAVAKEYYRRIVVPYKDAEIESNGDVREYERNAFRLLDDGLKKLNGRNLL